MAILLNPGTYTSGNKFPPNGVTHLNGAPTVYITILVCKEETQLLGTT
jgi:hypothetical protein